MEESKKGNFTLNMERWKLSGMGSTTNEMYDCVDCTEANIPHTIIVIPGPPAPGNEVSCKGDPTTIDKCTGCGAESGPWVPAPW